MPRTFAVGLAAAALACGTPREHGAPETARESVATAPPRSRAAPEDAARRAPASTQPPAADPRDDGWKDGEREARAAPPPAASSRRPDRQAREADRGDRAPAAAAGAPAAAAPARADGFTLRGRLADVGGVFSRSIRIERDGARTAQLRVGDGTRVSRDGRAARLADLEEGDEVRATFELRGDAPFAVEIEARSGPSADAR
jgi:hypothetical protein